VQPCITCSLSRLQCACPTGRGAAARPTFARFAAAALKAALIDFLLPREPARRAIALHLEPADHLSDEGEERKGGDEGFRPHRIMVTLEMEVWSAKVGVRVGGWGGGGGGGGRPRQPPWNLAPIWRPRSRATSRGPARARAPPASSRGNGSSRGGRRLRRQASQPSATFGGGSLAHAGR
jgi:hypothetical protein